MITLRTSLLAAMLLGASIAPTPTLPRDAGEGREGAAAAAQAIHGFDFEFGDWRVHHRIKRPTGEWYELESTCTTRSLMGGASNVEEHTFARPTGTAYGVALRTYDAEKKHWSIWWVDSRYMSLMGDPAVGNFENDVGNFYSDYTDPQGKVTRGRLTWSNITPTSARWEQASSTDGGKTWEPNWVMTFQRM